MTTFNLPASAFLCKLLLICVSSQTNPYNGSFFNVLGTDFYFGMSSISVGNFNASRASCRNLHPEADLPMLKDEETLHIIRTSLPTSLPSVFRFLGLLQGTGNITHPVYEPDWNFTWIDGTPASTFNSDLPVPWHSGEPNGVTEECTAVYFSGYIDATDLPCGWSNSIQFCAIPGNIFTNSTLCTHLMIT